MLALQREAAWAEDRLLGDLRQSVPQTARVNYYATVFLLRPPHLLRCDPSLRGEMSVKPREMLSAQGGRNSKSLWDNKFWRGEFISSRVEEGQGKLLEERNRWLRP